MIKSRTQIGEGGTIIFLYIFFLEKHTYYSKTFPKLERKNYKRYYRPICNF